MDVLAGLIEFLLWLFGIHEERTATREQCAQMWEQGYVVYPLNADEQRRAKQCAELMKNTSDNY